MFYLQSRGSHFTHQNTAQYGGYYTLLLGGGIFVEAIDEEVVGIEWISGAGAQISGLDWGCLCLAASLRNVSSIVRQLKPEFGV